jgi:hypothetical protein
LNICQYNSKCRLSSPNLHHENCPEVDLRHVESVTSLGSIAKSENETSHQHSEVDPFEYDTKGQSSSPEKISIR